MKQGSHFYAIFHIHSKSRKYIISYQEKYALRSIKICLKKYEISLENIKSFSFIFVDGLLWIFPCRILEGALKITFHKLGCVKCV